MDLPLEWKNIFWVLSDLMALLLEWKTFINDKPGTITTQTKVLRGTATVSIRIQLATIYLIKMRGICEYTLLKSIQRQQLIEKINWLYNNINNDNLNTESGLFCLFTHKEAFSSKKWETFLYIILFRINTPHVLRSMMKTSSGAIFSPVIN